MAASSNHVYGYLKFLKNDGRDGSCYPLMYSTIIGSGANCDIRLHAQGVDDAHCSISPTELGRVKIKNLSRAGTVKVNGTDIKNRLVPITHCDVVSIAHRSFRFEYSPDSPFYFLGNVTNSEGSNSRKSNVHLSESKGPKTPAGGTPFSKFSSQASRQVAVVSPLLRVTPGNAVEDTFSSKSKDEKKDNLVKYLLSASASSEEANSLRVPRQQVVNVLATPRRYRSSIWKSGGKLNVVASRRAGSISVAWQPISESAQKKKSVGVVENHSVLRTPRPGGSTNSSTKVQKSILSKTPAVKSASKPSLKKNSLSVSSLRFSEKTPTRRVGESASKKVASSQRMLQKKDSVSKTKMSGTKTGKPTPGRRPSLSTKSPRMSLNKSRKSQKPTSTGKKNDYSSQIENRKRKRQLEEVRSERAAKRLKLQGTPKSPDKKKSAALKLMCRKKLSLPVKEDSVKAKFVSEGKAVPITSYSTGKIFKSMLPVRLAKNLSISKSFSTTSSLKKNPGKECLSAASQKNLHYKSVEMDINKTISDHEAEKKLPVDKSQQPSPVPKFNRKSSNSSSSNVCVESELQATPRVSRKSQKNTFFVSELPSQELIHDKDGGNYVDKRIIDRETEKKLSVGKSQQLSPVSKFNRKSCSSSSSGNSNVSNLTECHDESSMKSGLQATPRVSRSHKKASVDELTSQGHNTTECHVESSMKSGLQSTPRVSRSHKKASVNELSREGHNLTDCHVEGSMESGLLATPHVSRSLKKASVNELSSEVHNLTECHVESSMESGLQATPRISRSSQKKASVGKELPSQFLGRGTSTPISKVILKKHEFDNSDNMVALDDHSDDDIKFESTSVSPSSRRSKSRSSLKSFPSSLSNDSSTIEKQQTSFGATFSIGKEDVSSVQNGSSVNMGNSVHHDVGSESESSSLARPKSLRTSVLSSSKFQVMEVSGAISESRLSRKQKSVAALGSGAESSGTPLANNTGSSDRPGEIGAAPLIRKSLRSSKKSLAPSFSTSKVEAIYSVEQGVPQDPNTYEGNCSALSNLQRSVQDSGSKSNAENQVEDSICQDDKASVSIENSFKKVTRSQSTSKSLRNSRCSNFFSSDKVQITPPNSTCAATFSDNDLPSVTKVPPSILKSSKKSLRSSRKSMVRFMKCPIEDDSIVLSSKEGEADLVVLDNVAESFNAFVNESSSDQTPLNTVSLCNDKSPLNVSPVNSISVKKRRLSSKTSHSTAKKLRNDISFQSNAAVCDFNAFGSDPDKTKRKCSVSSVKYNMSGGMSDLDESSYTDLYTGNETSFDFDSVKTPKLSEGDIVSPLLSNASSPGSFSSSGRKRVYKMPSLCLVDIAHDKSGNGISLIRIPQSNDRKHSNAPDADASCITENRIEGYLIENLDSEKVSRIKNTLTSPLCDPLDVDVLRNTSNTHKTNEKIVEKVKKSMAQKQKSPLNDLSNVRGVKRLMRTPKIQKSPANDLTNVGGVKKLFRSPKVQKSPLNDLSDVRGLRKLMRTPKTPKSPVNDLTDVGGVKKLFRSPKVQKSPLNDISDVRGIRRLLRTPKTPKSPLNDLSDLRGVKGLLGTPKVRNSPLNDLSDVRGLRRLMRTPKTPKSPVNDLSDLRGVKGLLGTPKVRHSPLNDLSDVRGLRRLMRTPKTPKSPVNDLSDLRGVKGLLGTPKVRNSPLNDLTGVRGVRRLLATPETQKSPVDDLIDVGGVKKLFQSPKELKSPLNDLSHVEGLRSSLQTPRVPKSPANDLSDLGGVEELLGTPKIRNSPWDNLSDLEGLCKLMVTAEPSKPVNDPAVVESVERLLRTPKQSSPVKNLARLGTTPDRSLRLKNTVNVSKLSENFVSMNPQVEGLPTKADTVISASKIKTEVDSSSHSPARLTRSNRMVAMCSGSTSSPTPTKYFSSSDKKTPKTPPSSHVGSSGEQVVNTIAGIVERLVVKSDDVASITPSVAVNKRVARKHRKLEGADEKLIRHSEKRRSRSLTSNSDTTHLKLSKNTDGEEVCVRATRPRKGKALQEPTSVSVSHISKETGNSRTLDDISKGVTPEKQTIVLRHKSSHDVTGTPDTLSPSVATMLTPRVTRLRNKKVTGAGLNDSESLSASCSPASKRETRRKKAEHSKTIVTDDTRQINMELDAEERIGGQIKKIEAVHLPSETAVGSDTKLDHRVTRGAKRGRRNKAETIANLASESGADNKPHSDIRKGNRNKKVESVENLASEIQEDVKSHSDVRKGSRNKKAESTENLTSEIPEDVKPHSDVRKGGRTKKAESIENLASEVHEDVKSHSDVRKSRRNKNSESVEDLALEIQDDDKSHSDVRKIRRNKNAESIEDLSSEIQEDVKSHSDVRKGSRNKKAESTENLTSEIPEDVKPHSDVRKGSRTKKAESIENLASEVHEDVKSHSEVRKSRRNKNSESVEDLALEIQDDVKSHSDVRKIRRNKNAESIEDLSSESREGVVRKGRRNKNAKSVEDLASNEAALKQTVDIRSMAEMKTEVVVEAKTPKQPARKTRQRNKENVDIINSVPENVVLEEPKRKRTKMAKDVAAKPLSPENVLQEVQRRTTRKQVTFSVENEDSSKGQAKTRAKPKRAQSRDKALQEPAQEATDLPPQRNTRNRKAR